MKWERRAEKTEKAEGLEGIEGGFEVPINVLGVDRHAVHK